MGEALHRHGITDRAWKIIAPHLPGKPSGRGGTAKDNRQFIKAATRVLRTGAPWRDLPPAYGGGKNTHRRSCRWRVKGGWETLPAVAIGDPGFERLMIDATHAKAHRRACGAEGGNEAIGRTQGGPTPRFMGPWMRMACRREPLPQRVPRRIPAMPLNWPGASKRMP